MRILLATVVLLAANGFAAAETDPYRWCAQYNGKLNGTHCWYMTYEQCRATVSGIGGYCIQNPRNPGPWNEPVRRAKPR